MRERLLGSSGDDLSRVYFMHECGSIHDVESAAVFHWDDLDGVSAAMVEREGASRGAVDRVAVSFADLLAAWQWVERLRASVGDGFAMMPDGVACPVCGSDEVSGWEFDAEITQAWQRVSCDDCGSRWNDIYHLVGRGEIERGHRVDIATARQSAPVVSTPGGVADWLDMAYEDRNGCGVES